MLKGNDKHINYQEYKYKLGSIPDLKSKSISPILELTETNSIDSQQFGPILSLSSEEEVAMASRFSYNKLICNLKNFTPKPEKFSQRFVKPLNIVDALRINTSTFRSRGPSTYREKMNSQPSLSPYRVLSLRDRAAKLEGSINIDVSRYVITPGTDKLSSRNHTPEMHSSREGYRRVVYSCFDKNSESYKALQSKIKVSALPVMKHKKIYFHRRSDSFRTPSGKSISSQLKHKKTPVKVPEIKSPTRKKSPEAPSKSQNKMASIYGVKPVVTKDNRAKRFDQLNEYLI